MHDPIADLLYTLEHKIIPETLFSETHNLIGTLNDNENLLYEMFADLCRLEDVSCPFTKSDFRVRVYQMDKDWIGVYLAYPIPTCAPFCYESYLFCDRRGGKKGCYMLEYGTQTAPDGTEEPCGLICGWNAHRVHMQFATRTLQADADYFAECFELHRRALAAQAID